ncbi:MAG: endonuclease III [candidate division NC10 bacterium]|nr:endonuclease III [candidate division NC10 bacterium]
MKETDINAIIRALKREVGRWNLTAVGQVAEDFQDPFRILVSCLLSLRTKDKVTAVASARLFRRADTPAKMLQLREGTIARLIYPVGFYRTKAKVIRGVCRTLIDQYGGQVPDSLDELLKLKGVGRKTANLVVSTGYGKPGICVDTHVHRISNRWGYVKTRTPEETEQALRRKLPRRHWIVFNDLLVSFGQNICKPISPLCSRCPVERHCARVGVTRSR